MHVSLAISGLWIIQNQEDFIWLQSLKSDNFIITWVNHSFTHRYCKDIAMESNFLLLSDTVIQSEILDTERILVENGEIPSIFFRFPGLISDEKFLVELKNKFRFACFSLSLSLAHIKFILIASCMLFLESLKDGQNTRGP